MKQFLLFFFFSFCAFTGFAQNFTVEPSPAILDEDGLDLTDAGLEPVNHATLTNGSSGTVSLRWERTILNAPAEWLFPVCDKNQCYFPQVSEAPNEVILDPSEESLLDVHVQPNGVAGCATVELKVTPFSNPDNVLLTTTYEFKINNPGECITSTENVFVNKLRVYPNPTSDLFKISELENIPAAQEIAVYNLVGTQVKSFTVGADEYRVGDLPNGLYLVSIIDENYSVLKTVRMSKADLRP